MISKRLLIDESGLTVAVETIILFSISIIFLGMIFLSFHDLTQKQNKILIEEELRSLGNSIANKMSDITIEARASNTLGSRTTIKSEFWLPGTIGDSSYTVKLMPGKLLLESRGTPYVSVEVPVNTDINLAENSTIYSMDEKHTLEYDSQSSTIYFTDGGVIPFPDFNAPTISIDAPAEGSNISKYTYVNTSPWDETYLSRVEFYVDGAWKYTAGIPWNWLWDTKEYPDGNYTVTAVAYDAAGHTKPAVRNFTIYNPEKYSPSINILSPPGSSSTDFARPTIEAQISDDKALDFSSFILLVDGVNWRANATITNITPPKVTKIKYIPSQNMINGTHNVQLRAKDLEDTLETWANWSFEVTELLDADYPTASIAKPTGATSLEPGTEIYVTYDAADAGSGLDNITINVRRGDGVLYTHYEQLSIYPDVLNDITQETWWFGSNYVGGMNYTYNITVFDRSGKSVSPIPAIGPLNISLPGQANELEVDTSGNDTSNSARLKNITIRDNVSDSVTPVITKINVTWVPNSTEKIERVRFGTTSYWTGSMSSGSQVDITDYTTSSSFQNMDLWFSTSIKGKTFTIVFLLGDTTTRTVTFYVPS